MNTNKKGKFITLEGIEGVGKSTNMAFISKLLDKYDINHILTREPGGTRIAEDVRNLLLNRSDEPVSAETEVLLFFAARSQHVHNLITPALNNGDWVICDRFTDSSLAYQGGGRELNMGLLEQLESFVQGSLRPDKVIILDLPVDEALTRVSNRGGKNRLDKESVEFFTRARNVFLQRARDYPERYVVVDATPELSKVQSNITEIIENLLSEADNR